MPKVKRSKKPVRSPPSTARRRPSRGPRSALWWSLLAPLAIVVLGSAAMRPGFVAPFTFDDVEAILENETIRQLWPIRDALRGPDETPVAGRPLVNLSLALNYAWGRYDPRGYHAFNLAIHLLSGCVLLGIVRRSLVLPQWPEYLRRLAWPLALVVALLWTVHPLQTEAVTYIVQRTELLMGLFYLLTLYAAIRGSQARYPAAWHAVAIGCCALGMLSKEVMVSAPLAVVLYDRALVYGSWREALARRWGLYAGLAATWGILLAMLLGQPRSLSVGFHLKVSPLEYLATQCYAIAHYLSLAIWPDPRRLVLDYGEQLVDSPMLYLPGLAVLIGLAGLTLWGWFRQAWIGLLGACFFMLLAPSSSFVPIVTEVMAERRMYLPLAVVLIALVVGLTLAAHALRQRWTMRQPGRRAQTTPTAGPLPKFAAAALAVGLIVMLTIFSHERLEVYRTDLSLWADTVSKRPDNHRALSNLGRALKLDGQLAAAETAFRRAIAANPRYALAYFNLGVVLTEQQRLAEAAEAYSQAIALKPDYYNALNNLGALLIQLERLQAPRELMQRWAASSVSSDSSAGGPGDGPGVDGHDDAVLQFLERAVALMPQSAQAHNNLGVLLANRGRQEEALESLRAAMKLRPGDAEVIYNYGNTLASMGRFAEAMPFLQQALEIDPTHSNAHNTLAAAYTHAGDKELAERHIRQAIKHNPGNIEARLNLYLALKGRGEIDAAVEQLHEVLRRTPNHPFARQELAKLGIDLP